MSWYEAALPVRMRRVAIVAPREALRDTLVRTAEAGCVEIDTGGEAGDRPRGEAERRFLRMRAGTVAPVLSGGAPDLDALERAGRSDLLAGEAELERYAAGATRRGPVAALAGWCPATDLSRLGARLAAVGGTVVPLENPRGVDPPTLLRGEGPVRRSFTSLVTTYGTVPYADVDPSWPAGVVYVLMFGVMFGDAGHGMLLLLLALALRSGRPARWAFLRPVLPFVAGAGVTATLAGVAYGEFFGPTGVLPALWLDPLSAPGTLLACSVAAGGLLLALAHVAGAVNRWREQGPAYAAYAASGLAGLALFLGVAGAFAGVYFRQPAAALAGAAVALCGLSLIGTGMYTASSGGFGGAVQTGVQLFDTVVRIGANTVSFARLAAFGLTHAALGGVVWRGTTALAGLGPAGVLGAAALFLVGNALTFALEALVAGIQALRLEFYELFSRLFESQGRPFRPWHLPVQCTEATP
ncbi:ATPase [Streptomyces sp. ET3-23]|uniref:V-type ATPase 116kDa subunit family protein n=1 Tax=Streptomyces sp. ET3-23 TaxID=2885643 RepID=UPI001D107260|nr:V-type ATPase 116kDa subunit family protein [Streptomyces sp. ET3-23]MCC2274405.1 ATPase [Streptomyces sp. ET3-23]